MDIDFKAKTATITMNRGAILTKADAARELAGTKYAVTSFTQK